MKPFLVNLLPIFILFLFPIVMISIQSVWRSITLQWLLALAGASIAWVLILFSRGEIPQYITLVQWKTGELFSLSPALLLDDYSWSYSVALTTLALSFLMTEVVQSSEEDWKSWPIVLIFTSLGLLIVMAENPLMLMMGWTAIDGAETILYLSRTYGTKWREGFIFHLSPRIGALFFLLSGIIVAQSKGYALGFESLPYQIAGYYLIAAILRLISVVSMKPSLLKFGYRRGLGTIIQIVSASSSLILLTRVATNGVSIDWLPLILITSIIMGLYCGLSWINKRGDFVGRPYWILGITALASIAAAKSLVDVNLNWSLAIIYSGGLLFFTSSRYRGLFLIFLLGFFNITALPLSPTWNWVQLYEFPFQPSLVFFIVVHVLIQFGYIRNSFWIGERFENIERRMLIIYPFGLALLPITYLGTTLWTKIISQDIFITNTGLWVSLTAIGIVILIAILGWRGINIPYRLIDRITNTLSFNWLSRAITQTYYYSGKLISSISLVMEGEGGILWAILLLILLLAFLTNLRATG